MKRIILLSPTLGGGGAERVCLTAANEWASRGKLVELILLRCEGAYTEKICPKVSVLSLNSSRSLTSAFKLWKLLQQRPDEGIMVFDLGLASVAQIGAELGIHRARIIYREPNIPQLNAPKWLLPLYPLLVNKMDGLLAQTATAAKALKDLGVSQPRLHISPNPTAFMITEKGISALNFNGGPKLISVGRLDSAKAFHRLLKAFKLLLSETPEAQLKIYGEGPLRPSLENQIIADGLANSVCLCGFTKDILQHLQDSNLFVMSSAYEGMPNALLEAIASGLRVLSTPAGGGVQELLESLGLNDCVMRENDWEELFPNYVNTALKIPESRMAASREKFKQSMNLSQILLHYEAALGEPDSMRL